MYATRTKSGAVAIGYNQTDSDPLSLPCGKCIGCRMQQAQCWALRNHLELQQHNSATFATFTYDEENKPPTLSRTDLAKAVKRIRSRYERNPLWKSRLHTNHTLRWFGCGEYGTNTNRPHYHAIIYGLDSAIHGQLIQDAWGLGHTRLHEVNTATINYVAGYTSKKITDRANNQRERVDPNTGEVYHWQPPFLQMSKNPGIGAHAKTHINSWRSHAVMNGRIMSVPRYLHEAWKKVATDIEIEQLQQEKYEHTLENRTTERERKALEQIAKQRQREQEKRRKI